MGDQHHTMPLLKGKGDSRMHGLFRAIKERVEMRVRLRLQVNEMQRPAKKKK